jgi:hypothetical protein
MIRHDGPVPLIAGAVDVSTVMEKLSAVRPVFHSEADFQHAFAWVLREIEPSLQIRLEVRQDTRKYVDLLCFGPQGRTAVEFKYFTRTWVGTDPATGESFHLRNHEATDLGRQGFVFDIARLEKFCAAGRASNGFAIMLSNDQRLWQPAATAKVTRDLAFRIHEGRTLSGLLRWGTEGSYHAGSERNLSGSYPITWRDYSSLDGKNGQLRWLAAAVEPRSEPAS